jgi:hypothetical protein
MATLTRTNRLKGLKNRIAAQELAKQKVEVSNPLRTLLRLGNDLPLTNQVVTNPLRTVKFTSPPITQIPKKKVPTSLENFLNEIKTTRIDIKTLINHVDEHGEPSLMTIIHDGNIQIVKYIVERGADVNKANAHGATPFLLACELGNLEIVTYLFEKGADVTKRFNAGYTALMIACGSKNLNINIINFLLGPIGVDVNEANEEGETALMIACEVGDARVIENLLNAGASTEARDKEGSTALTIAVEQGNQEIINLLSHPPKGGRRTRKARTKRRNTAARRTSSAARRERSRT